MLASRLKGTGRVSVGHGTLSVDYDLAISADWEDGYRTALGFIAVPDELSAELLHLAGQCDLRVASGRSIRLRVIKAPEGGLIQVETIGLVPLVG